MIFSRRSGAQGKEPPDSARTQFSSQLAGEGLEREYEEIVRAQLHKLAIPLDTVHVEAKPAGTMKDGRSVYLAMVRLVKWHQRASLRLLIALPLLEMKTRQSLETSWLLDVSHFGGLWLHASTAVRSGEALGDMRDAIAQLELATSRAGAPSDAGWTASMQAALQPARDAE